MPPKRHKAASKKRCIGRVRLSKRSQATRQCYRSAMLGGEYCWIHAHALGLLGPAPVGEDVQGLEQKIRAAEADLEQCRSGSLEQERKLRDIIALSTEA